MIASVGEVNGQRVALLKNVALADLSVNEGSAHKKQLYKQVATELDEDELAVFDAGFKLVEAVQANIQRCLIRLAKNCIFGKTAGQIPERTSEKGRPPTQYKAEIVRPLARQHSDKTLPATEADEIRMMTDERGREIEVHIWHKLYFLERQLSDVTDKRKKQEVREMPLKVMAIYDPDYDEPLLVGTPLLSLKPAAAYKIYVTCWPAATLPPFRTGFWDRVLKPTYGRLLRHLKKVGIPLSEQLFKKDSVTAHLPVGYDAIRLAKT